VGGKRSERDRREGEEIRDEPETDEWPSPYGGGPHPRRILGHVEEVSCSAIPALHIPFGANLTATLLLFLFLSRNLLLPIYYGSTNSFKKITLGGFVSKNSLR
jgi:hypothetical protein